MLRKEIYDWTGGFNTYTKDVLEKINLDKLSAKGYIMHAEMKYKTTRITNKFKEFPIDFAEKKQGYSKMDINIILEAFLYVIKINFGIKMF